ncbi:MAG: aminotransferase class III-fold pyridoxal phosphate-dependent enzyme [Candidatus Nanopelagicaceae bacterium]|jgi:glutamate-1-semialdehyde 2,1-aminomutase|nr:aminotransferase class III-fold pyridoxal phosphate-dependent enzyme [Candidatus Nanopelagicaceae bacterium]
MFNTTHHHQTFRSTPNRIKPVPAARIQELLEIERAKFTKQAPESGAENLRASKVTPLGVASSFQHWDPYPISIVAAKGAWLKDVDGREMLDLSMGFGALLVGHLNEEVVKEAHATLDVGTLFATPSPITRDGAEIICRRFGLDMVRFANSGTEATMYALRTARAATGKLGVIKIEGGYHGSFDPLMVSAKPALDKAGDPHSPNSVPLPATVPGDVYVVPYNDADAIERVLKKDADKIACVFMEPVLENIGIVLPDMGYLERVRELCDQYGVLLVFDEVKTGLTAGPQGAAQRLGVKPDLIALAKSIGGGIPVAAFGGKREYMDVVVKGHHSHLGTFNGHYLAMAGIRAVDRLCTPEALQRCEDLNRQALTRISDIINEYEIPAHTVGFGVKGCITWSPSPVRNYRDYKATDFDIAELSFFWSLNRNVMTPPGLDEQWLISLAHGQREIDIIVGDFLEFAQALRA